MKQFSYSKIKCFENCPKMFMYRYIERPKIEYVEGIEAFMGKRVHESLEWLHKNEAGEKTPSLDEIFADFEEKWGKKMHSGINIVDKTKSLEDWKQSGKTCLENYYSMNYPFSEETTISTEERIKLMIGEEQDLYITGFVDRIGLGKDGIFRIHDYKTGKIPKANYFKTDLQMPIYAMAWMERFAESDPEKIEMVWHYVRHKKKFTEKRNWEELNTIKGNILGKISGILGAVERESFPAKKSPLCNWCEYKKLCSEKENSKQVPKTQFKTVQNKEIQKRKEKSQSTLASFL